MGGGLCRKQGLLVELYGRPAPTDWPRLAERLMWPERPLVSAGASRGASGKDCAACSRHRWRPVSSGLHAQGTMAWRSRQPPCRTPSRMHRACHHRHPAARFQPARRQPRRPPRGRPVTHMLPSAGSSGLSCRLTCATQRGSRRWECGWSVLTWRATERRSHSYRFPAYRVCSARGIAFPGRQGHHTVRLLYE